MSFFRFIKSKSFFIQVGIAVVGVLLFIFILQWWLGYTTNHDQKIQVPDLNRMSLVDVEAKLKELDLDFIVIDSASYNPNYPKRSVIEQSPEAGDFVKEKRKIYLTLNPSKYRDITIPDLNGRTKRQAMTQLQSIGFKVGEFSYVRDIGKDVVRGLKFNGRKLKPGEKLPKNAVIDMILGDGKGR
ncbi:PASTA domain-containing protein [Pseudotenacibaculum sp. MALMAid0570]|uniref:PASTA domain-containing protein n=1 Tax=Pseudotenacibaculum sp. MALMAid0570 TaxID=3143938 RepID=UPI0032DEAD59